MIFQTEKQLKEYGDKLSEDNKTKINEALENLKKAHQSQELASIDSAMEALNTTWQAASQEMYATSQGADAGANTGAITASDSGDGANTEDSEVSDVEFEEVEDKDKKK